MIILIVGASGSGKSTLGKQLEHEGIAPLVSFTTREMREGEVQGVDYFFDDMAVVGSLGETDIVERTTYDGHYYGLYTTELERKVNEYDDVYFITDVKGAKTMQEKFPGETLTFWLEVDVVTMVERMAQRGDSDKSISNRIKHAVSNGELEKPKDLNAATLDANKGSQQMMREVIRVAESVKDMLKLDKDITTWGKSGERTPTERVAREHITNLLDNSQIHVETVFDKVTIVSVKLPNGFVLVESSGAVDPANYDIEKGKEICLERIETKLWELEGYTLQNELTR